MKMGFSRTRAENSVTTGSGTIYEYLPYMSHFSSTLYTTHVAGIYGIFLKGLLAPSQYSTSPTLLLKAGSAMFGWELYCEDWLE